MVNTIIQNINDLEIRNYPKELLKLNSTFKKMGFKSVGVNQYIRKNTYFKDLTLFICPKSNDYSVEYDYFGDFNYSNELDKLNGNVDNVGDIVSIEIDDEDKVDIKIKDEVVGLYLSKRNLVVCFIPLHHSNMNTKYKKVLAYFLKLFGDFIKTNNIKVVDNSDFMRNLVISEFAEETKKEVDKLKTTIRLKEAEIKNYQQSLINSNKIVFEGLKQVESLEILRGKMEGEVMSKIEEIKLLPFVKKVNLSSKGIRVDFNKIFIKVGRKKVEMGEYYTYIKPNSIEIENKQYVTYDRDIYHSPHIRGDSICFGDGKEKVYQLLGQFKLKELVYFLYLYLKSYNAGDTYLNIKSWIKCKEHGGVYNPNEYDD